MIAEIGQITVMLALMLAILQAMMPLLGTYLGRPMWLHVAIPIARAQCVFLIITFALLTTAFIQHDFSLVYVFQNSNTALPLIYRISAVWGGHEGSLLLWVLILSGWTVAVTMFGQRIQQSLHDMVIAVLGLLSTGFLLLLIFTSNPFARLFPAPLEGRDLNPLLQDIGLAIHPPMLYMGYVGFSVTFAFVVSVLLSGRMDSAWVRWARPWTLAAWIFLTIGITLGSWWAYYELGWGGWWFWDPVENASFMPWLVGTALLHSLAVTEARGLFKSWTVLLAILTFSFCLLGTFLVRSGILISVHSFAFDPDRGVFILIFLVFSIGSVLALYAWRVTSLRSVGRFSIVSRETLILINNIFLTVAAFSVLLGTMYPLILDVLGLGKISVGAPYFNSIFIPLAGIPVAFAAVGGLSYWKSDRISRLIAKLSWPFFFSIVATGSTPFLLDKPYQWSALLGLMLAYWVLFASIRAGFDKLRTGYSSTGSFWGMCIAHMGVSVFIIGVTIVSVYGIQKDVLLRIGAPETIGDYTFELLSLNEINGANYSAIVALVEIAKEGEVVAALEAEKRRYHSQLETAMTEAGIYAGLGGDWYVSLGEPVGHEAWSARLQYKPFVRFIWGGTLLMALGGIVSIVDRRYRYKRQIQ